MKSESDFDRLEAIFKAVCDLPEEERTLQIDRICGEDSALRSRVLSLFEQEQRHQGGLLSHPLYRFQRREPLRAPVRLLKEGDELGDYRIESFLDRGGLGEIYRARQISLGDRPVALKVVNGRELSERDRRRFRREARYASQIHHKNLVEIYAYGEDEERELIFYAMQCIEGVNLSYLLDAWTLSAAVSSGREHRYLIQALVQVCEAVAVIHARGLIHADIKPANIILEGAGIQDPWLGRPVLVDLGLVPPQTAALSTVWATPAYAAPELLTRRSCDERSDVYSLGLTAYDLLSKRPAAERWQHGNEPDSRLPMVSALVPEIDRDLAAIVQKATDPAPDWRYQKVSTLAADWRAWLGGRPVSCRRLHALRRVHRWIRLHPERVLRWTLRSVLLAAVILPILSLCLAFTHSVRLASESWREGDLLTTYRALQDLPATLDFLLPDSLSGLSADLRDLDSAHPESHFIRAQLESGITGAGQDAASWIEANGLTANQAVNRHLLWTWRTAARPLAITKTIARLFQDRPALDTAELRAADPFRKRAASLLSSHTSSLIRLYSLTILSGTLAPDSLEAFLELRQLQLLESGPVNFHDPTVAEEVEKTLTCISAVIRHARCDPTLTRRVAVAAPSLLPSFLNFLDALVRDDPQPHSQFISEVLLQIALAERNCGLSPTLSPLPKLDPEAGNLTGSARLDRSCRERLENGPYIYELVLHPGTPARKRLPRLMHHLVDYGRCVALFEDEQLHSTALRRLADLAETWELSEEETIQLFQIGFDEGEELLRGRDFFAPIAGSHLGDPIDSRAVQPPVRALSPLPSEDIIAWWDFTGNEIVTHHATVELKEAASILTEETLGSRHLRLLAPGEAEIALLFHESPQVRPLYLELEVQNSVRNLFPWNGEATISIRSDGQLLARRWIRRSTTVIVPLDPMVAGRNHRIDVQLDASSETTVRLFSARVRHCPD